MSKEYFFSVEGCHITELSNSPSDPNVSIAQARVEPGVTTAWHRLKTSTERYVIISGTGRVEVGDATPRIVNKGDVVYIAAMERQRITNVGDGDLIFMAICTPRFLFEDYESVAD